MYVQGHLSLKTVIVRNGLYEKEWSVGYICNDVRHNLLIFFIEWNFKHLSQL